MESHTKQRNRFGLAGFFLLGALLGSLGSLLVVWQYHLSGDPRQAGLHFLALNAGFVLASFLCSRPFVGLRPALLSGIASVLAALSFALLPFVGPPAKISWRLLDVGGLGLAAGALSTALFQNVRNSYRAEAAPALTSSGLLFSAGSFAVTVLTLLLYNSFGSGWEMAALAALPCAALLPLLRWRSGPAGSVSASTGKQRNLRAVATVLLSLLLFFQFGNEWALAGWLPILLIRRLGTDSSTAVLSLALYFLFLALARTVAQRAVKVLNQRRLLLGSMAVAMAGYGLLAFTHTVSAAFSGIVLIGFGFGPVFPLLAESLRTENLGRHIALQPGMFNSIFSVAVTGAMATPWMLGYVAEYLGTDYLLLLPALGSVLVMVLALLLLLEGHIMRSEESGGSERPGLLY